MLFIHVRRLRRALGRRSAVHGFRPGAGRSHSGGPAKVAIITSSLFGTRLWQCRRQCDDDRNLHHSPDAAGGEPLPRLPRPDLPRRGREAVAFDRRAADATDHGSLPPSHGGDFSVRAKKSHGGRPSAILPATPVLRSACSSAGAFRGQAAIRPEGAIPKPDLPRLGQSCFASRGRPCSCPCSSLSGCCCSGYFRRPMPPCAESAPVIPTTCAAQTAPATRDLHGQGHQSRPWKRVRATRCVVAMACACAGTRCIGTNHTHGLGLAFTNVAMTASHGNI